MTQHQQGTGTVVYTLFFSRLRDLGSQEQAEYGERLGEMKRRAVEEYPGFLGMKSFVAEDGERLTVVRFADEESQRAWRLDVLHREAQQKGRTDYYERYHIVICQATRSYEWERQADMSASQRTQ